MVGLLLGLAHAVPGQEQSPSKGCAAASVRLYDDPRVVAWSQDFLDGQRDRVRRAVEQDLTSAAPHPFAPHVWTVTQSSRGQLRESWAALTDPALREALGSLPAIFVLVEQREEHQSLQDYPPARAGDLKDVWALMRLAYVAMEQARSRDALEYIVAMARLRSEHFQAAWAVLDLLPNDDRVRRATAALVGPGGAFAGTLFGRFLDRMLRYRPLDDHEALLAVEAWLAECPHDSRALRFKAQKLAALERWDEAAATYASAMVAYPFFFDTWRDYAATLLRLRREAEARQVLARLATRRSADAAAALPRTAEEMARALVAAGEKGKARQVLEAAIQRWPEHAELWAEYAAMELKSGRAAEALPFARRAVARQPNVLRHQLLVLEALQGAGPDHLQQAQTLLQDAEARFAQKHQAFYGRGSQLLAALGDSAARVALGERAVAAYPGSAWMIRELADALGQAGRTAEALERLRASFDLQPPSQWSVNKLREWVTKDAGTRKADDALALLRQRFPWVEALWEEAVTRLQGPQLVDQQLALWLQASAVNPGRRWPWRRAITLLSQNQSQRWQQAQDIAERALADVQQRGSAGDRVEAIFDRAVVTIIRLRAEKLDRQRLEETLHDLEAYRNSGGFLAAYHEFRAEVLWALERKDDAAQALLAAVALRPDQRALVWDLVTRYAPQLGSGKALAQAYRYLHRDPYDGERLALLIKFNVMWYGSPIRALQLLAELKERAPDKVEKAHEAMAWGKLGNHAEDFRIRYSQATHINTSDRYLGWYEDARRQAQSNTTQVKIDDKTGLATITHPDGQVVLRRDHPVSGRPSLLQVGAAKVEAEYDDYGDKVLRLVYSSGLEVSLRYAPDGTIEQLSTNQGAEARFTYDAAKRPVRVALQGIGEMHLTYNQHNELEKVEAPGGHTVVGHVARAAQELVNFIQPIIQGSSGATIPELPDTDPALNQVRSAYKRQFDRYTEQGHEQLRLAVAAAAMPLAKYLVDHRGDRRGHADEARAVLEQVIGWAQSLPDNRPLANWGIEAVALWYELMRAIRKEGLSGADWQRWAQMRDWLDQQARERGGETDRLRALLRAIDEQPLELLQPARWLPRSYLNTPGYWRRYRLTELLPAPGRPSAEAKALLVRQNNDVVVGTGAGLCVLRRGFWEWFGFDETRARFSASLLPAQVKASSDVLSLAEDAQGLLWVGTAHGLLRLSGDYDGPVTRWRTKSEGLPTPSITHLAPYREGVLVGTAKGLRFFSAAGVGSLDVPALAEDAITFLKVSDDATPSWEVATGQEVKTRLPRPVLVGTPAALYGVVSGQSRTLVAGAVDDALWSAQHGQVFILRHRDVSALAWDGRGPAGPLVYVRGQRDIVSAQKIYGLARLPLHEGIHGIAVLTDLGLSIYHDHHFEHFNSFPHVEAVPSVRAVASHNMRTYMLTSAGLFALERGQILGDNRGRVHDLLTAEDLGVTFVARGQELQTVRHDQVAAGGTLFARIAATHLARDRDGRLLTNDGVTILRYAQESPEAQELFRARPTVPAGWTTALTNTLTSLLAASDGSIWVTAGSSVFRWQEGTVEEFSIFVDPQGFPARSDMISRVLETVDGRIWVVASNERHRNYHGVVLEGGVLEWTGSSFQRLPLSERTRDWSSVDNGPWFITGYTPIDNHTGIVGTTQGFARHRTTQGFARHRDGRYVPFTELKEASYQALLARTPLLWLGTRGAKLGEDTWLFGTAGGVVAYQAGRWFWPDRLNGMLPDQHLRDYGALTVHAVATDKAGHIYVGTDRGLLIYDSGGGEAVSFLLSNALQEQAFLATELAKLRREAEIVRASLPPNSALAMVVQQVEALNQEIQPLKSVLAPGVRLPAGTRDKPLQTAPTGQPRAGTPGDSALDERAQLALRYKKELKELLFRIERENRSLYQLLELKPLDLAALRAQLRQDQAVVQYLPTKTKLYIHLVTTAGSEIREVHVPEAEVQARALRAASQLAGRPEPLRHLLRTVVGRDRVPDLPANLAWLYTHLLRPVEGDLRGRTHVFVVPVGPLTYLPFAALIDSEGKYAVEHFTFGYLPSLYLLDLVLRARPSRMTEALVLGDPDGTLPWARQEAHQVHKLLKGTLGLGKDASLDALRRYAPQARVVHLATPGVLDPDKPERSALTLANDDALRVVDAMLLELTETELVVLSACQTGEGIAGMEYAALVRAFAHAGVPTVVATLWRVEDSDSTWTLMDRFYQALMQDEDRFTALARAQREMLEAAEAWKRTPRAWAGYIAFGKP
jgi:CHAT domain-containing protein/predicted Zn-dependent protease